MKPLALCFLPLLLALAPAVARAQVIDPDPRFSVIDPIGVGDNSARAVGGANPGYDVSVRDIDNHPVTNALIVLRFAGTGVRVYVAQTTGSTVDAGAQTVSRVAATGSTKFALRTGGFVNANAVEVDANGEVLGQVRWRSTDVDGQGGSTGLADFTYFSGRFLAAAAAPELNFDLSTGDVPGLGDFTIFSSEYLAGGSGAYAW